MWKGKRDEQHFNKCYLIHRYQMIYVHTHTHTTMKHYGIDSVAGEEREN